MDKYKKILIATLSIFALSGCNSEVAEKVDENVNEEVVESNVETVEVVNKEIDEEIIAEPAPKEEKEDELKWIGDETFGYFQVPVEFLKREHTNSLNGSGVMYYDEDENLVLSSLKSDSPLTLELATQYLQRFENGQQIQLNEDKKTILGQEVPEYSFQVDGYTMAYYSIPAGNQYQIVSFIYREEVVDLKDQILESFQLNQL